MFGLGGMELAAILVIALIIFGPKRLPEIGKTLGKGMREFKSTVGEIEDVKKSTIGQVDELKDSFKVDLSGSEERAEEGRPEGHLAARHAACDRSSVSRDRDGRRDGSGSRPAAWPGMPGPVDREAVWRLIGQGRAGLATDFDGTVSPIVSPPEAARPLPGVEASLSRLVDHLAVVALVSGRTVADLALRIDVPGAVYVGNHGLEWWPSPRARPGPADARPAGPADRDPDRRRVAAAGRGRGRARGRPGRPGRRAAGGQGPRGRDPLPRRAPTTSARAREILAVCHGLVGQRLQIREGKQVVELVLPRGTDKGTAIDRLIAEHRLDRRDLHRRRPDRPRRVRGLPPAARARRAGAGAGGPRPGDAAVGRRGRRRDRGRPGRRGRLLAEPGRRGPRSSRVRRAVRR